MIQKIERYGLVCDRCGKALADKETNACAWSTPEKVGIHGLGNGWKNANELWYCPDCFDGDNGKVRPFPDACNNRDCSRAQHCRRYGRFMMDEYDTIERLEENPMGCPCFIKCPDYEPLPF